MINISGITDRQFVFKTKTCDEAQAWNDNIMNHIKVSDGVKHQKSATKRNKKPWKFDNTSEDDFMKTA
jgi:hypothetical protein